MRCCCYCWLLLLLLQRQKLSVWVCRSMRFSRIVKANNRLIYVDYAIVDFTMPHLTATSNIYTKMPLFAYFHCLFMYSHKILQYRVSMVFIIMRWYDHYWLYINSIVTFSYYSFPRLVWRLVLGKNIHFSMLSILLIFFRFFLVYVFYERLRMAYPLISNDKKNLPPYILLLLFLFYSRFPSFFRRTHCAYYTSVCYVTSTCNKCSHKG